MAENGKTPRINKFEDIIAWQLGREIAGIVYELTKRQAVRRDLGFVDQVRRAAVSVMSNIAEGYERSSNREFVKFLFIARGSMGEVRSLVYVAKDQGYIDELLYEDISGKCRKCSVMIWRFVQKLKEHQDWKEV
jgi:four helix bundle protein